MKQKVPQIRHVLTPPDTGIKDLSKYVPDFIKALTTPLTDLEKASGTYQPPTPPRIAMTGTIDEIMAYFEGDQISPSPIAGGPWCWMTDGGAIVPPTEERVAQMLKGTKHKPTEEIRGFGSAISETRIANVEKVAINAVMAGCKPEFLPVVLAIAEASGGAQGYWGDCPMGHLYVTSGPIGKEIGLNYGFGFLAPGNKASETIRRAAVLMGINLSGLKFSVNDGERMANLLWGQTFSESPLTPWETLNAQNGYASNNSVLYSFGGRGYLLPGVEPHGTNTSKASTGLEGFQVGSPEQLVEAFSYFDTSGGAVGSLLMTSDAANVWINKYGFKTADQLKKYLYENALTTMTWAKGQYYPAGRIVNFDKIPIVKAPDYIRKWDLRGNPDYKTLQVIVAGGAGPAWGIGPGLGFWGKPIVSVDKWR